MSTENSPVIDNGGGSGIVSLTDEETAAFAAMEADSGNGVDDGGEPPAPRPADTGKKEGEEGDGKQLGSDKQPQHVPLAALHEERNKRKALGGEVDTLKTQLAETNGKLAILLKLKGGEAPADGEGDAPKVPTAEEDIFAHVKHIGETQAQLQKRLDDEAAATKAAGEQQTFVNDYRADFDAFSKAPETSDMKEAYNFLILSRVNDLIAIGYENPLALKEAGADVVTIQAAEKALHDAIVADEFAIAQRAFSAKKSPAATIYALAKARGYQKKAAEPGKGADGGKPKGDDALDRIEQGQRANKSLNDVGGGGSPDDMSAERLLSMSLAEFEKYNAKHPDRVKALMGG